MKLKNIFAGKVRRAILFFFDCYVFCVIACAYYIAIDFFDKYHKNVGSMVANAAIILGGIVAARLVFGVYNSVWRYTRTFTYLKLVFADILGTAIAMLVVFVSGISIGLEIFLILSPLNCLATLCSRYCYRLYYKHMHRSPTTESKKINIAIVGAGQLGAFLANELLCNHQSTYHPLFFIDKDPQKIGNNVVGLKVYSEDDQVFDLLLSNNISEIFVAVATLDNEEATRLFEFYSKAKCKLKIYDIPVKDFNADDDADRSKVIRDFQIEDLLFREPMKINNSDTRAYYSGKTILVTGGGGSIGSELCRQIAKCSPKKLIVLDIYENNAYDIQQELKRLYGDKLDLAVEIASVRDRDRLDAIFSEYRPNIVFHAAAHKHVPLMEHSGCEAIKNNVMGTFNTADMAEKYRTEKFILISTDKAVNPTNIMGASKRMCEMVIQCRTDSDTLFMAVRFGNVLGSNGSVIPLFREQIKQGGPVTITDKRIIRYFMTIPEAVSLVLQAGASAKGGEIFVLDMGEPVKILDLAENLIRLSGYKPYTEIKIEFTGLRPGEKLFEEMLMSEEGLEETENRLIHIGKPIEMNEKELVEILNKMKEIMSDDGSDIRKLVKRLVPTYTYASK